MPYRKGQSGNPRGRPKGTPDRRTRLFQELVPYGEELVTKAVSMALEGDSQMLALCINKLIPNPRPVDQSVSVSTLKGSLSEKGDAVLRAMANGKLTPTEASTLVSTLALQAKLVETDELTKRIEVLENDTQKPPASA